MDYGKEYSKLIYLMMKEEEIENIKKLGIFYEGIKRYAFSKNIPVNTRTGETFYNLRYNDIGFEIGESFNNQFFIKRVLIKNELSFINFEDIINEKDIVLNKIKKINRNR